MTLLVLSKLKHTWLIDLDGTVLKHNGYLAGGDVLLEGVREFWSRIPSEDFIIILTSRDKSFIRKTKKFLRDSDLRFDSIIFGLPFGERVVINDLKPTGLTCAHALNVLRDGGLREIHLNISDTL